MSDLDALLDRVKRVSTSDGWIAMERDARLELAALRAENEAMRKALRELLAADEAWWYGQGDPRDSAPLLARMDDARRAARSALAAKGEA